MTKYKIFSILVLLLILPGCAAAKATRQPTKKDLSVLREGTDRSRVIAEIGSPAHSMVREGKNIDIFNFVQGYSTGAKAGRALFHGVADVFTLGLWEVVGTPIEGMASGTLIKIEVKYDKDDKVMEVTSFGGGDKVKSAAGSSGVETKPEPPSEQAEEAK
jgi:hypothetical protein